MEPWSGTSRGPWYRADHVRGRHGDLVPPDRHAALPRLLSEGRPEAGYASGTRVRDRRRQVAPLRWLATRMRFRMSGGFAVALPSGRRKAWIRGAGRFESAAGRLAGTVRRIRLRSRQTRSVSLAADPGLGGGR